MEFQRSIESISVSEKKEECEKVIGLLTWIDKIEKATKLEKAIQLKTSWQNDEALPLWEMKAEATHVLWWFVYTKLRNSYLGKGKRLKSIF